MKRFPRETVNKVSNVDWSGEEFGAGAIFADTIFAINDPEPNQKQHFNPNLMLVRKKNLEEEILLSQRLLSSALYKIAPDLDR